MINELLKGFSKLTTTSTEVKPDILLLQFTVVNACMVGDVKGWTLIDTGLENSSDFILKMAKDRFGDGNKPKSIVLTHGHFDHVGSVKRLSELWDVPVYIHKLELDYVTGKKSYPQGDSTVDEGLVAKMSPAFPNEPIDIGHRAVPLPSDGSIPGMPHWKWIYTPGHTDGHVSLFREKDRVLIAGDAFTTTKQESFTSVLSQREEVKGPPAYLTTDWETSRNSIEKLRDLEPHLAIPSHGLPMDGEKLSRHLDYLLTNFNNIAVPEDGKYVDK